MELLNGLYKLDSTLQNSSKNQLLIFVLYGSEKFALNDNKEIVSLIINFLKASKRFVETIFWLATNICIYFF